MKQIKLTQDKIALVDDNDYEKVASRKWHAYWNPSSKTHYAVTLVCTH